MDSSQASRLAQLLKQKKADRPCPRCGHVHFSIVGETGIGINPPGMAGLSTSHIPATVVACSKCGYLSLHANAILEKPLDLLGGVS
jgi:ribosomal protein S27AE